MNCKIVNVNAGVLSLHDIIPFNANVKPYIIPLIYAIYNINDRVKEANIRFGWEHNYYKGYKIVNGKINMADIFYSGYLRINPCFNCFILFDNKIDMQVIVRYTEYSCSSLEIPDTLYYLQPIYREIAELSDILSIDNGYGCISKIAIEYTDKMPCFNAIYILTENGGYYPQFNKSGNTIEIIVNENDNSPLTNVIFIQGRENLRRNKSLSANITIYVKSICNPYSKNYHYMDNDLYIY